MPLNRSWLALLQQPKVAKNHIRRSFRSFYSALMRLTKRGRTIQRLSIVRRVSASSPVLALLLITKLVETVASSFSRCWQMCSNDEPRAPVKIARNLSRLCMFSIMLSWLSVPATAQEATQIATNDGFRLTAFLWKQDVPSDAVLLLHQCDSDQSMYARLAELLFAKGFHVVSVDYRGYGKSVNDEFNLSKTKTRRALENMIRDHDRGDLDSIMKFCLTDLKDDEHSISLFGASCGGDKVLYLAETYSGAVRAYGILSSRMDENTIERANGITGKPAIFIAAERDRRAYATALTGFRLSTSESSLFLAYKGAHHGNALFRLDPTLETSIADWFARVALNPVH